MSCENVEDVVGESVSNQIDDEGKQDSPDSSPVLSSADSSWSDEPGRVYPVVVNVKQVNQVKRQMNDPELIKGRNVVYAVEDNDEAKEASGSQPSCSKRPKLSEAGGDDICDTTTAGDPSPSSSDDPEVQFVSVSGPRQLGAEAEEKVEPTHKIEEIPEGYCLDESYSDYGDSDEEPRVGTPEYVSISETSTEDEDSDDDVVEIPKDTAVPPSESHADNVKLGLELPSSKMEMGPGVTSISVSPVAVGKLGVSEESKTVGTEFTSEIYKIELLNVSHHCGYKELKKLVNEKLQLNVHKFKLTSGVYRQVFFNFKNEADREKALEVLDGYSFRGQVLKAKHAEPAPDPLTQIQERKSVFGSPRTNSDKASNKQAVHKSIGELVMSATTPWSEDSYDKQLQEKQCDVLKIMQQLTREVYRINPAIDSHVKRLKDPSASYDKVICEVGEIIGSPVRMEYRNKSEFTVGINPETNERTVGFRISSYEKGSVMSVGPVDHLCQLPSDMKKGALAFQTFVQKSIHAPYDPSTHLGVWKQLTVRTTQEGQIMLYVIISTDQLNSEEVNQISMDLKTHFEDLKDLNVTSFYVKIAEKHGVSAKNDPALLFGESAIMEQLFGLKFRISPDAFFQVNTKATEVLYSAISELAELDENTTLLDICCGTGSIGLSCLKLGKVGEVLGVDWTPSAIVDAKMNADENGLSEKCQYFCGKAEDLLSILIGKAKFPRVVAIVDPPRSGLHFSVIHILRNTRKIKSLVYVACNARSAMQNFLDLAKPLSKRFRGDPFKPLYARAVDLFPDTPHVELILSLQRIET